MDQKKEENYKKVKKLLKFLLLIMIVSVISITITGLVINAKLEFIDNLSLGIAVTAVVLASYLEIENQHKMDKNTDIFNEISQKLEYLKEEMNNNKEILQDLANNISYERNQDSPEKN